MAILDCRHSITQNDGCCSTFITIYELSCRNFITNRNESCRTFITFAGNRGGARQVGKTTLVDEFAREFDVYLKLNLEKEADHALFEQNLDIGNLITAIFLSKNKPKTTGRTLLFIDEIQNSPRAVEQLRYFYEEVVAMGII